MTETARARYTLGFKQEALRLVKQAKQASS